MSGAEVWQNAALSHSSRNKAGNHTALLAIEGPPWEKYHIVWTYLG
jgi:hypothetical protein